MRGPLIFFFMFYIREGGACLGAIYTERPDDTGCVSAVGTFTPSTREAASDLVAASRLYADHIPACRAESGEYLIPLREGLITENHIAGSIGQLLTGKAAGRISEEEITMFDALGLAVEDIASAKAVLLSETRGC